MIINQQFSRQDGGWFVKSISCRFENSARKKQLRSPPESARTSVHRRFGWASPANGFKTWRQRAHHLLQQVISPFARLVHGAGQNSRWLLQRVNAPAVA